MKNKLSYKSIYKVLSFLLSLGLAIYSIFPSLKNPYFYTFVLYGASVSVYYVIDTIKYLKGNEIEYKTRKFSGIFLMSIIFPLDFGLLFLMLFPVEGFLSSLTDITVYSISGIVFLLLSILRSKKERVMDRELRFFDYSSFIYFFYASLICLCCYLEQSFYTTWIFVFFFIINAILTLVTFYMALYLIASGNHETELSFRETCRSFASWLQRYQIFYFIGIAFMMIMGVMYYLQDPESNIYKSLFGLFAGMAALKLVFFIWNYKLKGSELEIMHSRYKIMMIAGIVLIAGISAFSTSIEYFTNEKKEINTFHWFLIIQIGFLIWRGIVTIMDVCKSEKTDNPYLIVRSEFGLVSMLLTVYGIAITIIFITKTGYYEYSVVTLAIISIITEAAFGLRLLIGGIKGMKRTNQLLNKKE